MHFQTQTTCRSYGSSTVTPVLSLREQFASNFVDEASSDNVPDAPLELVDCSARVKRVSLIPNRDAYGHTRLAMAVREIWLKITLGTRIR
jgi:hypothetical protein